MFDFLRRALFVLGVTTTLFGATGCFPPFWLFDDDDDGDVPPSARPPQPPPAPAPSSPPVDTMPPVITDVVIPEWPPLGPDGGVEITVTDNMALGRLDVAFFNAFSVPLFGTSDTAYVSGFELGEGFGLLGLSAADAAGLQSGSTFYQVLVDLTPPEFTLGETIVPANGELEVWVADTWVLGYVELEVAGTVLVHAFEDSYPETLGQEWHYSQLMFPMTDVPPGDWDATLTVADAAGNTAVDTFTVAVTAAP
jgi:hypothetical protein